ncbi:hypothetical protein CVT24_009619 [Panaeolus cyanescens]|uniref:Transcription factor CBF/NF-Y/archaeal histone domain-containing protein n=1 Tax=Panaeolus cyanescens TaxID=181874 RepID=A0A409Y9J7_9AGAR|nr:hypothetical protein CVT24_009619 [Panaeolus cyanescens]
MKNKNKQTKFPVARIKKIMQKDEEVGKVAQATPVVISKALELFLGLIIEKSSDVTTERGSKKVEVYHLKHAVETTEMLDFLKDLVQDIPDPSAGGTIDLEAENAEGKKKRGKGKRAATGDGSAPKRQRKKKGAAAEEDNDAGVNDMKVDTAEEDNAEMQDDPDEYDEEPDTRKRSGGRNATGSSDDD